MGWLHSPEVIHRGFLVNSDFPNLISNNDVKSIIKSHFNLFATQNKKVRSNSNRNIEFAPSFHVHVYKHASQQNWNGGKWGLDKNTELSDEIKFSKSLSFETNYFYWMGRALIVNLWSIEIATKIIRPFVKDYKLTNNGDYSPLWEIHSVTLSESLLLLLFLSSKVSRYGI